MGEQATKKAQVEFHRAANAEERGKGVCRTCLAPIWNEGGMVGYRRRNEGWSDRIERGGDSLVCFKAVDYRHVPLDGREAAIYDKAMARGLEAAAGEHVGNLPFAGWHEFTEDVDDYSMCICGVPALSHDVVYPPRDAAGGFSCSCGHSDPELCPYEGKR